MKILGRVLLLLLVVTVLGGGGFYIYLKRGLPDVRQIETFRPNGTILMTARDGTIIYAGGTGPREKVTSSQIPKILKQALVASEDRRFYEHNGVDIIGIGRAIVSNIRRGEFVEGGSTITQQLARVMFLSRDKNLTRKLQEAALAWKLEHVYTKEQILVYYLNNSYFGGGAYGVADASHIYFNKSVQELTTSEAATLIGLLPAPSVYSPLNNPLLARKRRDQVLNKMAQAGVISTKTYHHLVTLLPRYHLSRIDRNANAYFTSYVQSVLPTLIDRDLLEAGGLTIETTLDVRAQRLAQLTLRNRLKNLRRVSQGAVVTLNPHTGEILALVGGTDFAKSQFNRATQALRQPGSAFKTFVYLTALEAGYSPNRTYVDRPIAINGYRPKNADGQFLGRLTLIDALAKSRNPIAVQLLSDVGIDHTIETCRRLGLTTALNNNLTLALGSSEIQLLEFTHAYGVIANGGVKVPTVAVQRIRDQAGKILYQAEAASQVVIDPQVAWTMTQLLEHVVTDGTGRSAQVRFPAAGKTGTTDQGRDLLFIGYTPQLVTGVWLGNDDDKPTFSTSALAAQVWGQYMRALVGSATLAFVPPPNLNPEKSSEVLAEPAVASSNTERARRPSEPFAAQNLPPETEPPIDTSPPTPPVDVPVVTQADPPPD